MTFKLHTQDTAPSDSQNVLKDVHKMMGFIPNLFAIFSENPEVLKTYLSISDAFSKSGLTPLEQQIVALTVSYENKCSYCMAAHSAISAMGKLDLKIVENLRNGEELADSKLESLRIFTKEVVLKKGVVDQTIFNNFISSGYSNSHALAVILGISMKTLSNYVNHLSNTPIDVQFKNFEWK